MRDTVSRSTVLGAVKLLTDDPGAPAMQVGLITQGVGYLSHAGLEISKHP